MPLRIAALIIAVAAANASANAPRCGIGGSLHIGGTFARAGTETGTVRLRGTDLSIDVLAERRFGRVCGTATLTLGITSALVRSGDGLESPLDDAAAFQAGLAVGAAIEFAHRWWARADIGPSFTAYVSPHVLAIGWGVTLSTTVSREFAHVGQWVFAADGRLAADIVPDGDQTWLMGHVALGASVRRLW